MLKKCGLFLYSALLLLPVFSQRIPGAPITLVYTHPNAPASIAGKQAVLFADTVKKLSGGAIVIEVYPDSQLGTLTEQELLVKTGMVAFTHNTAASMGGLYADFAVLDTPFMYDSVSHLLKVTDPESPVMKKLDAGILSQSNVRVLYSFYFGTRQLTADRPVFSPDDLAGVKIRAIPFPIYTAAVEGMGAIPVPLDWAETPSALVQKTVSGQENPVNTIAAAKLWESQSHLMMTNHNIAASFVVMNDTIWQKLTEEQQRIIRLAAKEAGTYATKTTRAQETADLELLRQNGMQIIDEHSGLDRAAFRNRTRALVRQRFGADWEAYYRLIDSIK